MDEIGVYIHIPFCKKKCFYCDFNSYDDKYYRYFDYKEKLINEINFSKYLHNYQIKSIFIGGGTPTILPSSYIDEIVYSLSKYKIKDSCEITIEANPGTISKDYLKNLKKTSVNRLSIGLQSSDDFLLKKIGRIHTYKEFLTNYYNARNALFNNINIDLMFSLPNQTFEGFSDTLNKIVGIKPEHISAYSLIIEQNTHFGKLYNENKLNLPSEETDRKMYHYLNDFLNKNGFNRYEISNFSRQGFESMHNKIYWQRGDYIGFGVSAHSFIKNMRFNNTDDLEKYINSDFIYEDKILIEEKDAIEEFIFLGLRLTEGISTIEFEKQFGKKLFDIYGDKITKLLDLGFLSFHKDKLFLTNRGIDVSNSIFSEILK